MAYSFLVLVDTKSLPAPGNLAKALSESGFPISIDTNWHWENLSGWFPMSWGKENTGCEIDLEALEKSEAVEAAKAGFKDLDVQLEITTRGWNSLKAAYVFAGIIAQLSNGCVTEGEDDYIDSDEVVNWMASSVEAAESASVSSDSVQPANLDVDDRLSKMSSVLKHIAGPVTKLILVNDQLSLRLNNGSYIRGNMWKLQTGDKVYDASRWRALKQQETDLLLEGDGSDEERMDRADAMQDDVHRAKTLDDKDLKGAYSFLKAVDDLAIKEARQVSGSTVHVLLSGEPQSVLEYFADAYLASVEVGTEANTARLSAPLPSL